MTPVPPARLTRSITIRCSARERQIVETARALDGFTALSAWARSCSLLVHPRVCVVVDRRMDARYRVRLSVADLHTIDRRRGARDRSTWIRDCCLTRAARIER